MKQQLITLKGQLTGPATIALNNEMSKVAELSNEDPQVAANIQLTLATMRKGLELLDIFGNKSTDINAVIASIKIAEEHINIKNLKWWQLANVIWADTINVLTLSDQVPSSLFTMKASQRYAISDEDLNMLTLSQLHQGLALVLSAVRSISNVVRRVSRNTAHLDPMLITITAESKKLINRYILRCMILLYCEGCTRRLDQMSDMYNISVRPVAAVIRKFNETPLVWQEGRKEPEGKKESRIQSIINPQINDTIKWLIEGIDSAKGEIGTKYHNMTYLAFNFISSMNLSKLYQMIRQAAINNNLTAGSNTDGKPAVLITDYDVDLANILTASVYNKVMFSHYLFGYIRYLILEEDSLLNKSTIEYYRDLSGDMALSMVGLSFTSSNGMFTDKTWTTVNSFGYQISLLLAMIPDRTELWDFQHPVRPGTIITNKRDSQFLSMLNF